MSDRMDSDGPVPQPGRSIWYTPDAIRRARDNIRTQAWAAREWARIGEVAERWAKVSDEEILGLVPERGSIFCSGRNGTPCCKAAWQCDVSQPRRAFCWECGREYPEDRKGSPFRDEGHGFYHDGKWFAPVPVWNSFIVSMLGTYSYGSGGPADNALLNLSGGNAETVRQGLWALFNASPGPAGAADHELPSVSSFAGHKGVVVLRSGTGDRTRALIFRGGANLLSQDDQLALFLYDRGRTVIEDVGYNLAGSHVHGGWGMRAISHAMVTVNEDIPTSRGYEFVPSASLIAFEDFGDVKVAEYSAPLSRIHQEATEYRRALFFCDVDEETSYALDIFSVGGGRVHDYAMNGPKFFEGDSGAFSLEGISPAARPGVWTLAALGTMDGSEEANAPGKSWGERIGPNDRIQGVAEADGSPLPYGWLPPPGNGYAFIHDVKTAPFDRDAYAHWTFGDERDTHFGVLFPADPDATFIAAKGPDLRGTQQIDRFVIRREGEDLKSLFVGVLEAFSGERRVTGAAVLLRDVETGSAAVRVQLADGCQDLLLFSRDGGLKVEDEDGTAVELKGRFGIVRKAGARVTLYLAEGTHLRYGDAQMELSEASFEARVVDLHPDSESVVLDRDLPDGMQLDGRLCRVEDTEQGHPYSHSSAYRVSSTVGGKNARLFLLHGDFRLSGGTVEATEGPDVLVSNAPLAFAWGFNNTGDKGEYRGKMLCSVDGTFRSRIVALLGFKKIQLESVEGLQTGVRFEILDFKPGDRTLIPNSGSEIKDLRRIWHEKRGLCTYRTAGGDRYCGDPGGDSAFGFRRLDVEKRRVAGSDLPGGGGPVADL